MKINIVAIGKIKESFFSDALKEYVKRISRYAEINVIEIDDAPASKGADEQKKIEGDRLLEKAKGYVVALDGGGKELSSEGLAELIDRKCTDGVGEFSFLIGGSHGHGEKVKERADFILSFGPMTFPHQLFRVLAAEQIYRALSINAGTPYHK